MCPECRNSFWQSALEMGNRCLLGNFLPGSNLASSTPHIVAECVQLSVRNDVTQKLSQNEWMIKLRGIKEFKATPGSDFTLPGEMSMKNPQYQKNRPDSEALALRSVCPPEIGTTLRHGRNIQKNGSESLSNILPFAAPSH